MIGKRLKANYRQAQCKNCGLRVEIAFLGNTPLKTHLIVLEKQGWIISLSKRIGSVCPDCNMEKAVSNG